MTDTTDIKDLLENEATEEIFPAPNTPEDIEADTAESKTDELDALRAEIAELKEALSKKSAEADMIKGQLGEFSALFPNVSPEDIPEEVWESVAVGDSLAAAYALYHRKEQLRRNHVRELNNKNAELSTGKVGVDSAKEYFTPNDVRAMSRSEVRANYSKILDSMKKWN